jgi:hypothetical protein
VRSNQCHPFYSQMQKKPLLLSSFVDYGYSVKADIQEIEKKPNSKEEEAVSLVNRVHFDTMTYSKNHLEHRL